MLVTEDGVELLTGRTEDSPPFEFECEETIEQMVERMNKAGDASKKAADNLMKEEEKQ